MHINRIAVVGAAAATMIASGAGFALASSSTPQRPAASGTEHFSLMSTQPSASKYVMIASGVFTASGTDTSGNNVDTVKLTGGTFKINHNFPPQHLKENLNQKTCLETFSLTSKFTLEDGTGKYKGISGSGSARISALAIARRSAGKCNPNANPTVSEQTIIATAHVHL
jgi:hypothetical protein